MPVKWWVLTENQYPRFLMSQLGPFGIRFTNDILYRAEIQQILSKNKPHLNDLAIRLFGPKEWEIARVFSQKHGLELGDYAHPNVAFALENGIPVGHLCFSSGTIYLKGLERERSFDDGLYLFNLFISPKVRKRGIGKYLMLSALEMAGEKGNHRFAYAYVREDNLASRRLMVSLGLRGVEVVHYLRTLGLTSYQTEKLQ